MSFRNRCRIAGAGGTIDLSIPLEKGRDQKTLIKDIRISGSRSWQTEHWKTILSCYSRSPWFEFYREELEQLYLRPVIFLADWDQACFEWSIRALGLSLEISRTDAYHKTYPAEGWVDGRGKILPKGARGAPESAGRLGSPGSPGSQQQPAKGPQQGGAGVVYRQVFQERTGFLPGLSILDLLFCEGKNARLLLS